MSGTKVLSLVAVSAFLVMAAPVGSAQAASLINPGAAAAVQQDTKQQMTTEVRWHWHRHHRWHRWHRR
jgi:predicted lipoprotein